MTTSCGGPECDRPVRARGYCEMHYRQWRKTGTVKKLRGRRKPCRVGECGKPSHARELCPKHYYRLLKNGSPLIVMAEEQDALAERMRRREKQCASCGQVKYFDAFYASNFTPDGCVYSCRDCSSATQSEWHKSHRSENRERSYKRRELEKRGGAGSTLTYFGLNRPVPALTVELSLTDRLNIQARISGR